MDKLENYLYRINISSPYKVEYLGIPSNAGVNPVELGAVLSGLPPHIFFLTYMYLTHDYKDASKEILYITNEAAKIQIKERWKLPKRKHLLLGMSALAFCEFMYPRLCESCKGHGQMFDLTNKLIVDCPDCHGSGGGSAFNNSKRARLLNMSESKYRKTWASRYDHISAMLHDWLGTAKEHVNNRW